MHLPGQHTNGEGGLDWAHPYRLNMGQLDSTLDGAIWVVFHHHSTSGTRAVQNSCDVVNTQTNGNAVHKFLVCTVEFVFSFQTASSL